VEFRLLSQALLLSASFCFSAVAIAAEEPPTTPSLVQQIDSGRQHFNHGRYEDALAAWNVALDQYQLTDNKNGQARILQYKADAYLAIGQYYKATTNLQTALSLAETAGDDQLAAEIAGSLGTAFLLTNRIDEARDLLKKAVAGEQAGGRWGLAAVAGNKSGSYTYVSGDSPAGGTVSSVPPSWK